MKKKNFVIVTLAAAFILGFFLWNIFGKTPDYSDAERRTLAKFPSVTLENVLSGKFAKDFETYATERFPMRDLWRRVKAYTRTGVFAQKDNHDIYEAEGHIAKLEYPMNIDMLDHAAQLFSKIHQQYLQENDVYFVVIPDKNRYLAEENGYLSMDYDAFSAYMKESMDFVKYIEIADLLEAEDYYYTDSHWRQEKLVDVAQRIADAMGTDVSQEYEEQKIETPFNGVYMGQSALVHEPDTLTYLTSDILDQVTVDGAKAVYDMEKANGRDPYEMFLSGNQAVVTMKNEKDTSGRRLIIFRDSFGSSIAPLFMKGYSEIVLIDLRHISSDLLGEFVDFEGADVMFLYSTLLLNHSLSMK